MESGLAQVEVDISTPHGDIKAGVLIPGIPMGPADLVQPALELSSRLASMAIEHAKKEGRELSCRKGCSACCSQLVPVSKPEAFHLLDTIRRIPEDKKAHVMKRFREAADKLEETGIADLIRNPDATAEDHRLAGEKYFALGLPCAFLTETGSCGIHSARPSACREYNVTTPAENCRDIVGGEIRVEHTAVKMAPVLARLWAQEKGGVSEVMPMPLAAAWAAEHEAERGPTAPGPELFGRFMGIVSRVGAPRPEGKQGPAGPL